jgi:H+-transporting ATPase
MLEAAILLQMALGEYVEAAIIAGLLIFNAALGFFQEGRAQAALAALKSKLALIASVQRDGRWLRLPAADLVPGDILKLSLGAVVPADVCIITGEILLDQSMLTGESIPVEAGPGRDTYAGALVRRGEAIAEVTATGARTYTGRTAELVQFAHAESAEQRAVLAVVRNLAVLNGGIAVLMVAYGHAIAMPLTEVIPLVLTAILASIPVALPATFTLATALSGQALARRGVLPTRLSAVHEAATMDVLCSDKTGTLTQNQLEVTAVRPMSGFDEARVLGLAAMTSSAGGQDPVDIAVRAAASRKAASEPAKVIKFVPFDPASKTSEAIVLGPSGETLRVVKGALVAVANLAKTSPAATGAAEELAQQGYRVLGVAVGTPTSLQVAGLIALSDPPRADAALLISKLKSLGITTVMVTGDAPSTAEVVARGRSDRSCLSPGTDR